MVNISAHIVRVSVAEGFFTKAPVEIKTKDGEHMHYFKLIKKHLFNQDRKRRRERELETKMERENGFLFSPFPILHFLVSDRFTISR